MIEKLLSRTLHDPNTGCFNWTKGKDKDGYGKNEIKSMLK